MKKCDQCGHDNLDEAKFCDGCGAQLEAETGQAGAAPPVEQVPAAPPAAPAAAPVPAPPAPPVAPPAYMPPPPAAPPVYGQPPTVPTAPWLAPGSNQWMKPAIIAAIVVAVIAVGFIASNTFLKPSMSAADYKAQITQIAAEVNGAQFGDLNTAISGDQASRDAAKAAYDKVASMVRADFAKARAMKPPAEFQSQHDRILKGMDAEDKVLTAMDVVYRDLVSGALTEANAQDYPALVAVTNLTNDPAITAAVTDADAAVTEIQAK